MIDVLTKQPLRVLQDAHGIPYLRVAAEQVEPVLKALQNRGVRCWQNGGVLTVNGGPGMGWITLGKNEAAATAQAILDQSP